MSDDLRKKLIDHWGGEENVPTELLPLLAEVEQLNSDLESVTRREFQLKESLAHYRRIVEHASDVVVIVDIDGWFEYTNPIVELLTGYRPSELLGKNLFILLPDHWLEKVQSFYREQIESRTPFSTFEFPIVTKNRNQRWVEQTANLLFDEGVVTGIEGSIRDITERRRAEVGLRKQQRLFAGLVAVAKAVAEGLSLDVVLQSALDVSTELTEAEHGSLFLFNDVGKVSHSLAAWGENLIFIEGSAANLAMEQGLAEWVVRNREAVLVDDIEADDRWVDLPDIPYEVHSALVVPIYRGNEIKGILSLTHSKPASFEEEHKRLMLGAAQQMSLALHNAQVYEDQKRLASHQEILYQTLRTIGEHLNIEVLLNTAVETIGLHTNWPMVTIFLPVKDQGDRVKLTIQAKREWPLIAADETLPTTEGIVGRTYRQGITQMVADVHADLDYVAGYQETRAELCVPLKRGDQVLGVLDIQSEIQDAFTKDDILLAESLADAIALALENATFFKEIQGTAERLREVDRLKSTFLAHVSHEIRTPMNAVIGMTNLLTDTQLSALQREYVDSIHDSGEGLLAIINDILDITKIEANKLAIENVPLQVAEIVDEVCQMLTPVAAKKGLVLHCTYPTEEAVVVNSDRIRIKQILVNLVGNAIKFTEHGRVELGAECQPGDGVTYELRFSIMDTGSGIPADSLEKIFEPFNRLDQHTVLSTSGTGLGLAISRRLAELMGGRIWAESEVGQGSSFYCYLPVEVMPDYEFKPAVAVAQDTFTGLALKVPLSILIAEDNLVNQKVLLRTLENMGYRPSVVVNGQEVLEIMTEQDFDVILMDVQMPILDGIEATRQIRAELPADRQPRIVGVTAHGLAEDRERCLAAGMDDYILKPFLIEDLVTALLVGQSMADAQSLGVVQPAAVQDAELARLQQFVGGAAVLLEVIEVFIADAPVRLADLQRAAAEQDAENLWKIAHALKSSSASLGAMQLSALCAQVETLGKANNLAAAVPLLVEIETEGQRVLADLEKRKKML